MKIKNIILFFLILTISATCVVLTGCDLSDIMSNEKKLIINEAMVKNKRTIADEDGEFSDWIELYNNTDKDINIKGYYLSDNPQKALKWQFPDITIEAREYMIVFVSGKDKVESDGRTCHTNFRLSAKGDFVILSSNSVRSIDSLDIPTLGSDFSYGRVQDGGENDGEYHVLINATPGDINSGKGIGSEEEVNNPLPVENNKDLPADLTGSGEILINEYMTNNTYICYDSDGEYSDWIELYNTTGSPVNLNGCVLARKTDEVKKWIIPDITIEANGYYMIWMSKMDKLTDKGEVHASFKMGKEDSTLVLLSPENKVYDSADVEYLAKNVSKGRSTSDKNKWVYFSRPTPGKVNNSTEYEKLANAEALKARGLWVSEVSSASVPYNDKQVSDWIEIYNGTGASVDLNGYGLSTDRRNKYEYKFGNKIITPGEYLLVYCTGVNPPTKYASKLHTDFKLDSDGGTIYLTGKDGITIDAHETGKLKIGYSSGRIGTEDETRYFFTNPTPGEANTGSKYTSYTAKPEISNDGGYVNSGTAISLKAEMGANVYYTIDGSDPDRNSLKYTNEIVITKNTVIKAIAVDGDLLPSDVVTATYLVGKTHTIPIVSITIKPDDFYGHNNGIYANGPGYAEPFPYQYANFWKSWERKITFEYYNEKGVKQLELDAGAEIFGQYSRAYNQKSLDIHFRDGYGASRVNYPFFENNDIISVKTLVLRAAGQDYKQAILRDPFCAQVLKGQTTLALMDWQPVAVYVNGEYFGFYSIREKINGDYFETHYGVDADNVDFIKGNKNVKQGSFDNYQSLLNYVTSHDLSKTEYYKVVEDWVDIDNYIDYLATRIFFGDMDTGNIKFFRENKDGAKWRWVFFDVDQALRNDNPDSIGKLLNPNGHGHGNAFSTKLQCALIKNSTFKNKFIERYAELLNSTFMPERMINILDGMVDRMSGEVQAHAERWEHFNSESSWKSRIDSLKNIVNGRRKIAVRELQKFFSLSDSKMNELFSDWGQLRG